MRIKNLLKYILTILLVFGFSSAWAKNTIKWSMKGDSLTLDPHAQNEGPTTMAVSYTHLRAHETDSYLV